MLRLKRLGKFPDLIREVIATCENKSLGIKNNAKLCMR